MARTIRNNRLDSRTARAQLARRHAPYWHALTRGRALGYRKGAKGGIWLAKYRTADGKREHIQLGAADDAFDAETSDVLSFATAQAKAREWFETLDREAGRRPRRYTVEHALDDYLAHFTGKSLDKTRYTIDAYLRPEFKDLEVSALTTERLRAFLDKIASRQSVYRAKKDGTRKVRPVREDAARVQKANANRVFAPLRAALNRAFAMGHVADDRAWRRVKPYAKVSAPRIRYFTGPEIHRLLEVAPEWFKPLVQAALLTGGRWSELYKVRVRDIDLMSGVVTFPETKSGRPRFVHLSDEGIQLFRGLCIGKGLADSVFRNGHDRELGPSHQIRPMRDACEAAGVEPAGFHILRHTYGSRLAMAGVPMAVIAEALVLDGALPAARTCVLGHLSSFVASSGCARTVLRSGLGLQPDGRLLASSPSRLPLLEKDHRRLLSATLGQTPVAEVMPGGGHRSGRLSPTRTAVVPKVRGT